MNEFLQKILKMSYSHMNHKDHEWGINESRRVGANRRILKKASELVRSKLMEMSGADSLDGVDIRLPSDTDHIDVSCIQCDLFIPSCTPIRFFIYDLYTLGNKFYYGVSNKIDNGYSYTFDKYEDELHLAVYMANDEWLK